MMTTMVAAAMSGFFEESRPDDLAGITSRHP